MKIVIRILFFIIVSFNILFFCSGCNVQKKEKQIENSDVLNRDSFNGQNTLSNSGESANVQQQSIRAAVQIITDSIGAPDTTISLDSTLFVSVVTNTARVLVGLYSVDIKTNKVEQIIGGEPVLKEVVQQPGVPVWYLFVNSDLNEGKMSDTYFTVRGQKDSTGNFHVEMSNLFTFTSDGESGLCGGSKKRAKEIHLDTAMRMDNVSITDLNNDNIKDIQFTVTQALCSTGIILEKTMDFLYTDTGFVRK